jgi:hypothetical protein
VRLFFNSSVRRFAGLVVLLFFALPFGLSVAGCGSKSAPVQYCSAGDTGPVVGQIATISLAPNFATTGESLNYGQIGASLSATAYDCKGNAVSVQRFTYASTSSFNVNQPGGPIFADIDPSSGRVCGGTWNRNTGGGIANYTTCTAPSPLPTQYLALVTATANGSTSNAIPVYVHPVATGIVIGNAASNCSVDPGTDCCPNNTVGTVVNAPVYTGGCISQNQNAQVIARIYQGGNTNPANNITCQVGHITFAAQSASIATFDQNGVATAHQPGSSVLTATISNSSTASQAGFLSTCAPASIQLAFPGSTSTTANIPVNTTQPFTATVLDTAGNPITGLTLEYISTTPTTIPAGVGTVTPTFPGSADITAVCLPAGCNPAPFSQIGYSETPFDPTNIDPSHIIGSNGKAVTSNPLTINVSGTSSTVLYMASTQSQYVSTRDFTTNQPASLIKLPYPPNSMVVNQTGSGVYFGSSKGLMSLSTASNILGAVNQAITGVVLSISPDGGTIVVTDPLRQTISLVTVSGGVITQYGGIATHAQWSSDAQSVYITTTDGTVLTHSNFSDWQTGPDPGNAETYTDVAVAVPAIGAFYAGPSTTDGRTYCSTSTPVAGSTTTPPKINNVFLPIADSIPTPTDRIAATTDGKHILGAHSVVGGTSTLSDIQVSYPPTALSCTTATTGVTFNHVLPTPAVLAGIQPVVDPTVYTPTVGTPLAITGVVPSSNSAAVFVTYTGTSGILPAYFPAASGAGTTASVALSGTATAPIAGVFSTDNFSFYAGTTGDNGVHIINLTYPTGATPTAVDSGNTINPNLPNLNGATSSPVNLIVQFPKKSTN